MFPYGWPPIMPGGGQNSFKEYQDFMTWMEERQKKAMEEEKRKHEGKKKVDYWPSRRDLFLLSPMIGIPVGYCYLMAFKGMLSLLESILK
jgi:hypothetical protein